MSFKVLISDALSPLAKNIFEKNQIEVDVKTNLTDDELKTIINNYHGLVVRSATKVTATIIELASKLKVIGRAGAGVDNIDLVSTKENNVVVMNTPGGNTNATAEHTIALLFSLFRSLPSANETTHKGLWEKKKFKGLEVKGKIIGLVGFGNVSNRVKQIAEGLGMEVQVFSKSLSKRKSEFSDIKTVNFEELLTTSDIISMHGKSTHDGSPIISLNEFNMMKKNAVIINTARGSLINENDLKYSLENSIIHGAALDVYSQEPAKENILFGTKNLILTPHIAASTEEAQIMVAKQISQQICDYLLRGEAINIV